MIKVAHITTIDASLRALLLNQLRSLRESGYDVVGVSSPGPNIPVLQDAGIRHVAVPITRNMTPVADFVSLCSLLRVIRRERFTIVHTHNPKPGLLGQLAARIARVPIVINTLHGFYFHEHMHPLTRRFYITMEKIAARCSDVILSQNREDIETGLKERIFSAEKVRYLGNGIDLEQFSAENISFEDCVRLRASLGILPDCKVVGFVGRLAARRKGFLDFLQAARRIVIAEPGTCFLVIGEADHGKPDAVDPSSARDFGIAEDCRFLGHKDNADLPALYKLMDVLVLPSLFEGIPRVVMEAAAMGVPAVVSNVKGNREAVIDNVSGILVPFADVQALTEAILGLLRDPIRAKQLGCEARRIAVERFDERNVFERVRSEYARLVAQPLRT